MLDRTPSRSHLPALLAALCLVAGAGGCALFRASSARQQYVRDQTSQHVYHQPIAQGWPEVRKALFERGLQAKNSDSGGAYAIETEPARDGDNKDLVRFLVQGTKLDDANWRLEVTKMTVTKDGAKSARDVDLEWQILQKLDPEAAKRIQTGAEQEAEKAKNAS